jgi:hypothetical protein
MKCTCITYTATHALISIPRTTAHPKHIIPTKIKPIKLHAHTHYLNKHASPPYGCNYERLAAQIPYRNLRLPSTCPTTRGKWVDIAIRDTGALLWNREYPSSHSPTPLTQHDFKTTTCQYEIGDDSIRGAQILGIIHSTASLHNIATFNHTTSTFITLTGILSPNPHKTTQDHTLTLREPINIMPKHHLHFPPHKLTTPRHIETKIFFKNI